MTKQRSSAYSVGQPLTQFAPQPVVAGRAPTSSDKNYEVGQTWVDTSTPNVYTLAVVSAGSATWALSSPAAGAVNDLVSDAGTATPAGGTINIVGGTGVTTSAVGDTLTITAATGSAPISLYVVDATGFSDYTTIQSAITAADGAGGGAVWVREGTYAEDLTLAGGVQVIGATGSFSGAVIVQGTHAPDATGNMLLANLTLTDATAILNSAAAGSGSITLENCTCTVTNGYTLDVANWTGALSLQNVLCNGTNDGVSNNTGGSDLSIYNSTVGVGTGQSMLTTGACDWQASEINCPVDMQTGTTAVIQGCRFGAGGLTFSNDSAGSIVNSSIVSGATAAVTMSSSGDWDLDLVTMDSSNNPCVDGAGAGTLAYGVLSFLSNSAIAATLTLSRQEMSSGTVFATTFDTDVAAAACTLTATTLAVDGTDANIGFTVTTKGTGTLALANGTAGVAVTMANGINTVAQSVTIAGGAAGADSTVSILSGNASAGTQTLNLATGSRAKTVNVATGVDGNTINVASGINTSAQTVNISSGAAGADSTVNILSGTATAGTQTLNLGTGDGAKAINVGNGVDGNTVSVANGINTSAQTVNIANGASAADSTVNILSGTATAGTLTLNLANGAGPKTVNVANGVEGSTVSVADGINTSAQTVSIANGASAADSTVNILSGAATAGVLTLNLANGAGGKIVNIATGVEGSTVNVATGINTSAQVVNISTGAAAGDSTVNILSGIATAGTQTFNAASADSDATVNLGTGAGVKTVTVGSTNTTSTTTINAGSGGVQIAGDVDLTTGSLQIEGAGQRLAVEGGAATDFIGTATLTNGTVTVAHTGITAADRVFAIKITQAGTESGVLETVVTASTNFVVNSRKVDTTLADDDSDIAYFIVRQL